MKKLLFILVIASFLISCKVKKVMEPEKELSSTWDGSYTELSSSGGVYKIYYPSQLAWIAKNVNDGNGFTNETVKLMNDIDLSDKKFPGIATAESSKFMGTFDGSGYSVKGLNIESSNNNVGFIGYLDTNGSIKNLNILGKIKVDKAQGIVRVGGVVGINYGYITNVTNNVELAVLVIEDYSGLASAYIGGIAGVNNSVIFEAVNRANIAGSVSGFMSTGGLGGIAGLMGLKASISKCYNSGEVSSVSTDNAIEYIGGLVGSIFANSQGTDDDVISISQSYNVGSVKSVHKNGIAGGIFGNNAGSGTVKIENCYNTANIDTSATSGTSGGLVGNGNDKTEIKSSYNIGEPIGKINKAIGSGIKDATSVSVYYLVTTTPADNIGGLTKEQFANGAYFNNFSFGDIWTMSKKDDSAIPTRRPTLIGVGYYLPPIIDPPPDIPR